MPRPLRINYPDACYHVMNRGAGRKDIFKTDSHRYIFLELLEEYNRIYNLKIYAYCLMNNHYHLLISTPNANLPRIMRHLNGVYTQKFNRTLNIDGTLFRGRYKAQLVEDNNYQLTISKYIHLNPVKSGLIINPAEYIWSSYPAYIGNVKTPPWLSSNEILIHFADSEISIERNYQDYVEEDNAEEIVHHDTLKDDAPIIGSKQFKEKVLLTFVDQEAKASARDIKRVRSIPEIDLIVEQVCYYYKIDKALLLYTKPGTRNWPKMVCMYICRKVFGHLLRDIVLSVGIQRYETVSAAVQKCASHLINESNLRDEVNLIVTRIYHADVGAEL